MCTRQPVQRDSSITWAMARFSAPRGREAQEVAVALAVRGRRPLDRVGVLGVHDHQPVEGRELAHRGVELVGVERRELVDAGVQQEALEAEDAGVVQRAQVGDVARDGAAPEADVDVRLLLGGLPLHLERGHVDGRRDAVQRHVHDRGHAAGGRGPGGAGEALPFGASGVVDVHVGVDQAGQQYLVVAQLATPVGRRARRRTARSATMVPSLTPMLRATSPTG